MTLNDIPPLLPPHGEIPPTFWEQHGGWILLIAGAVLAVLFTITLLAQKRVRKSPPIEVLIRDELERLRRAPANGRALSQVSRCVRRYFVVAFALPQHELTTAEFIRAARQSNSLGAELTAELGGFLSSCDEAKFSPEPPPGALMHAEAATRGLALIEQGEARRAALSASETGTAASQKA
jgi:hypothetical protein